MTNHTPRDQVVQEIARHQPRLRGLLRCLLVHSRDVDDLLQEINLVLWEKADEFQLGSDFWAWASQIARFKVLNQFRKTQRERRLFDDTLFERLAELADERLRQLDERRAALDHCLSELPPAQRQLLDLRYAGDQTLESLAVSIGRSAVSIRQTLFRIRAALLKCIEGQLDQAGEHA